MPPKKIAPKKKKGDNDGPLGIPLSLEEQVQQLVIQTQTLEVELAKRSDTAFNATRDAHLWEEKLTEITTKYQEEQELKLAITRDMTRQYRMMQVELISKLTERERNIEVLTDDIQKLKVLHQSDIEKKEFEVQNTNQRNTKLEEKLEELCKKFSDMMSSAYDNLTQRINVESCLKQKPAHVPILERMEEFSLAKKS